MRRIYAETENTELNALLKEIQDKIILPAYLPEKQRKIVFDPTKKLYLDQNPIDIEVEGHEHRFKTLVKSKDIPRSREALWKALRAMETTEDWQNLGTLLAGYRKAGIVLAPVHIGKITRLATESGQVEVLVECLKQASETGLYITNREQFIRILMAINAKVVSANADVAQVKRAARMGEILLDLVQRPENVHRISRGKGATRSLLNFSALGRSMLLHARVSVALAKQAAEEPIEENLVVIKDDLALLQSLWAPFSKDGIPMRDQSELVELRPANGSAAAGETTQSRRKNPTQPLNGSAYTRSLAWAIRGIETAQPLAPEETAHLNVVVLGLKAHAGQVIKDAPQANQGAWSEAYESVLRGEADSPTPA